MATATADVQMQHSSRGSARKFWFTVHKWLGLLLFLVNFNKVIVVEPAEAELQTE